MRYIVNEDGAGAALGPVAPELRAREPELVAQRPGQCFLLHDVGPALLPVDFDGDERFSCAAGSLARLSRGAEQVAYRGNCRAAGDDPFDEVAPRGHIRWPANHLWGYHVAHLEGTCCRLPTRSSG